MRPTRLLVVPFLLLALAACKKAAPPERFVPADAKGVVLFPSLEAFAQQTSDALDTAATFPGGQRLKDFRALAKSRLGFDLFDPKSMADAGIDAKRAAVTSLNMESAGGMPEAVLVLPVSDEKKFGATMESFAKNGLEFPERGVDSGKPDVVTFGREKDAPAFFAYAVAEKSAVLSVGPGCVDRVRAALAVPKDAGIATSAGYKAAMAAVGPKQAVVWFMKPPAEAAEMAPEMKEGFALGFSAAKDRVAFAVGMPLAPGSAYLKLTKADAGPLVEKLDPGAAWVVRSDVDSSAAAAEQKKTVLESLRKLNLPEQAQQGLSDALDSIGGGFAFGAGVTTPPAGATIEKAPLSFFRAEMLVGLKDAAKMKGVLELIAKATDGKFQATAADGPWMYTDQGGELGVAIESQRLLLAVGPAGALKALSARSGTTFKAPTATAQKAFAAPTGGAFVDVPKLVAGLKAFPVSAYGEGAQAEMIQSSMQENLQTIARIAAISWAGEVKDNALHGELVVEIGAAPAK